MAYRGAREPIPTSSPTSRSPPGWSSVRSTGEVVVTVLDGDGTGNVFVVAQAILDAVDEGSEVINMSFGTAKKISSKLLEDAIREARSKGVVVVGAAGNEGNNRAHFPAAQPSVLSVAALDANGSLAGFSDWGAVGAGGCAGRQPYRADAEWRLCDVGGHINGNTVGVGSGRNRALGGSGPEGGQGDRGSRTDYHQNCRRRTESDSAPSISRQASTTRSNNTELRRCSERRERIGAA
jgi:hypothetical protein